jgi:hypothetical protein
MAYNFVNTSSQYLGVSSLPVTALPFTFSFWFYTLENGTRNFMCLDEPGASSFYTVNMNATGVLFLNAFLNGSSNPAGVVVAPSNQWNHGCAVFTSTSSRQIFLNGVAGATNTGTVNPTFSRFNIGLRNSAGVDVFARGDIAETGVWNVALTAAEIASLAKGVACNLVRPQSLVFYAPLVRELIDVRGGRTITNNNGATVVNHPRIYL